MSNSSSNKKSTKVGTSSKKNKKRRVRSVAQIVARIRQKKKYKTKKNKKNKKNKKIKKPIKPIIPPKSLIIILKEKPEKAVYSRRIIDYKYCGLLERYLGRGGKILPRRRTKLTAKQQRYVAKTIKNARIMGLLAFVSKEKGFFR